MASTAMVLETDSPKGTVMGCCYKHVTVEEREEIMVGRREGRSIRAMARKIGRSPSTVKCEMDRNSPDGRRYLASAAQRWSDARRPCCRRYRLLVGPTLSSLVQTKILLKRRSPEQAAGRLALERGRRVASGPTIKRAIARRELDAPS